MCTCCLALVMLCSLQKGSPSAMSSCKKEFLKNGGRLPGNVTFRDYAAMLGEDASHRVYRQKIRDDVIKDLQVTGPCGKIKQSTVLTVEGNPFLWHYLQPCALINRLCQLQPRLGDLIRSNGGPRLAVYMDEIKPGNVLRPDHGRAVACFYWTFANVPGWFQCRQHGWFFFAGFPVSKLDGLLGGYTGLFTRMLEILLLDEPWNFQVGFPCASTSGTFVRKGPFSLLLCDEKAMVAMWSFRGASGTKPCFRCQNVVGHMTAQQVESANLGWIQHYSCANPNLFAEHNNQTFNDMRNQLRAVAHNKKECNRLGQLFGLHYSEHCPLWHRTLHSQMNPLEQTSFDWMHVIVASGGVGQYELNEFCKSVKTAGINLSLLDEFAKMVCLPKQMPMLPKRFFQDRVNTDENTHMKTFASEVLVAVPILVLFAESVLQPAGLLADHCQCLIHLSDILDVVRQQEKALAMLDFLQESINKHGILFKQLYPGCCKPKFHWLFHLPDDFRRLQVNMSCFAPERKHRAVKTIGSHVLNQTLCEHVADRMGYEVLKDFENIKNITRETFLEGVKKEVPEAISMLSFWSGDILLVQTGKKMKTTSGSVDLGDVLLDLNNGAVVVPIAFLEVTFMTGVTTHLMQISVHKWKQDSLFEENGPECLLEWHNDLRNVMFTRRSCGSIHVLLNSAERNALRLARGEHS